MAKLVAIEGADGVGKNTTATTLCAVLTAAGQRVTVMPFPRYGETVAGVTIGRFLAGELPVPVSTHAAAVLYALDRFEWKSAIADAAAAHDVVIFDRYIASNMAYQAAKEPADRARAMMDWILDLETRQFGLPCPDLSIYLDTPWQLAKAMILQKRTRSYTDRSYDEHEANDALQLAVRANYETMVSADLLGPWKLVKASIDGAMRAPGEIAAEIAAALA